MILERIRWKSLSLKTLFILMTVFCLGVGAWSVYVNPYRLQAQSLAAVRRLQGATVQSAVIESPWQRWLVITFLGSDAYAHVTSVDLSKRQVSDDDLKLLTGLSHLEALNLDYTDVTDAAMPTLRAMPKLKDVSIRFTKVGDEGCRIIAAAPNLQVAHFTGTKITDNSLPELSKSQGLRQLYIRWTRVSTGAAQKLSGALPGCEIFHQPLPAE
jgi:hypothetical protein